MRDEEPERALGVGRSAEKGRLERVEVIIGRKNLQKMIGCMLLGKCVLKGVEWI